MTEEAILTLIETDEEMMRLLRAVERIKLPDWLIGAGFVRGKVWDSLSGFSERTPLSDIDVIYFDPGVTRSEKEITAALKRVEPGYEWEATNQATMHGYNNFPPYHSTEDALAHWVETATCVGVRIENGALHFKAPYGLHDLVEMIIRPTPYFATDKKAVFIERQQRKRWKEKWPMLRYAEGFEV